MRLSALLSVCLLLWSCNSEPIEPFELSLQDFNYASAYSKVYSISNEGMKVVFKGELENESDRILFTSIDIPTKNLKRLSQIDFDNLKAVYSNQCVLDGDIKLFTYKKKDTLKNVLVENYFHEELSPAIDIINELVPREHQLLYDEKEIKELMKGCEEILIMETFPDFK
ncbi:hypothetical protein [Maribacter flavus]|uniref:Uncharacterized protein n=1 Tax=Maribacter flavus TaxID=1658664 RepID=A0A5B2TTF1_9FLAO|nr:hypothetical protein [Maribacter flavus]KAA2216770.1 hypothetical protein F0361_12310 [Maribacter flavus]